MLSLSRMESTGLGIILQAKRGTYVWKTSMPLEQVGKRTKRQTTGPNLNAGVVIELLWQGCEFGLDFGTTNYMDVLVNGE